MSQPEQSEQHPQEAAREALLRQIAAAANAAPKLNPGNAAEALKNLAEAYAFVVAPSQPH
ncbi:hypothetical protein [Streptomyces wuyuanensis]|uniref:Uncharacterized protein n=1 Tax=Streptomyces wuyuanensis TaxID=1196353 RepID=A0A1G9VY59_9ACTN|nr:hypothetical protein [Streptomyces wuyuanensis]SDM76867.1 hypothetical protein SAMN05444921_11334 [Streptomyces wuyuanensis]